MSKLIIEIHDDTIEYRSGESAKTGKPWEMHEQEAWIRFLNSPYPTRIVLSLNKLEGQQSVQPLKKGAWTLDPAQLLKVGNFGGLTLDDRRIQSAMKYEGPLKSQVPA